MHKIKLHDTRSGQLVALEPRDQGRVSIYACGPTVYGQIHIGNARPFVVFSLLKRFLQRVGYEVTFVANITDINDKIYVAAREQNSSSSRLAEEMTELYIADTNLLELGRPDHEPKASEMIKPIVDLIEQLITRKHAYVAEGDVYFSVRSYPKYGELSHRLLEDMDQGESQDDLGLKRDPLDFALWKAQKEDEDTAWDAPWGRGRPGWHIECSAMAEQLLGVGFDIHGGGSDLVFPHHENEAAQSGAAHGKDLAQIWMHNGMIRLGEEKMAKSVGNIRSLNEVVTEYGRDTTIMYFLGGHYRQPLIFSPEQMQEAAVRLERIRESIRKTVVGPSPATLTKHKEAFYDALINDFNTPKALAEVFEWVRAANRAETDIGHADLKEMLGVIGLESLFDRSQVAEPPAHLKELLMQRETARKERDFTKADQLRDQILAEGWVVRDGPEGPELVEQ